LIQIEKRWDEGPQQISAEAGMYEKLELKKEDERWKKQDKKLIQVPLCGLMFTLALIVVMYCRLRLCHYVPEKIL
jgi:hypothetical protein